MLNKLLICAAILISSISYQAIAEDSNSDKKDKKEEPVLSPEEKQAETLRLMDLFSDVYQKVRDDYVTEETDKKLIEAAINGMLTNLDPHSSFLNEEDFKDMQEQTKGEFGGLGIEVTMKNGLVYVVAPIDDTPAFKAGIKAGDYISHIDGEAVYGLSISEAVKKMRGKPGESIDLKVIREGEKRPLDITIVRDIIKIKSVKSKVHDDVAYVRITSFTENTGKQVEENIKKMFAEIGKDKVKGVVLDLRNNPGGLLTEAINVSDDFLNSGEIVSTRGRHPEDSQKFSAETGDVTNGLPVVVLINGGSASASEIVAGALQDQKRAVIIGEKSFGKGSVQTVIPVASNTAIRLTTSRYYTPSGKSIQAEGITPDIEVRQGKVTYEEDFDKTKEANLAGHLENEKATNSKEQEKIKKLVNKLKKDKNADISNQDLDELAKSEEDKPLDETDYQLARALDLVRALFVYGNR
jgi:carboxyl-terminal processing protease